jgi:hypothetical protein
MKAFILSLVAAIAISVAAGVALNSENETTAARYSTASVRL